MARRRMALKSNLRGVEALEGRQLLATFSVTNLNPTGSGSLAQAIIQSNKAPGADTIDFGVAGTIRIGKTPLPSITGSVTIDGSSSPSFAGSPVVILDFHGSKGLDFARGADGSTLTSLSLINARNAGVTLDASNVTVQGNYIGLKSDGTTAAGNRGDGVRINATSHGDVIGHTDPVSSISYYSPNSVSLQPVSAWQGIRSSSVSGQYLLTGTSGTNGLLYQGPISGVGGTSYAVDYPGATATSVYGPDVTPGGGLRLVGSYKDGTGTVNGFLFQGTTADLPSGGSYRTIDYPGAQYTYIHSTMGGLAVGNADGPEGNAPLGTGHAFLYDVARSTISTGIVYPGSTSTTAYGIWSNGGTKFTIAGGYSNLDGSGNALGHGYLVDYDSSTGQFSNWASFDDPNGVVGQDYITHFEGISSTEKGVYTLVADSVQRGSSNPTQGSFVSIRRNPDGTFGPSTWVDLNAPGFDPTTEITSANSVAGNQVVGTVIGSPSIASYQATVNMGFQLSNVISGNGGNGVGIYGANNNQVAMNLIGTDATGTIKVGNAGNGILLTKGAKANRIGGQATGGNDPTGDVFARPPQGNLISGNARNGVLIQNGATQNTLSGNFIGTAASGNSALGNRLDGVSIENASGNQLIGCTFQQDPFVFYNVISGNGGNGLHIANSNDTTVQANFLGVGANNATIVANGGDGLLVSGTSKNTQVGGVIPLGNVISGNNRNGIEVRDQASGFISFNTFAGLYAFGGAAPNRLDGMLVTSSGGNNVLRTNIVSGNLGNGIEIGGNATGVQVTETAVGTNTNISASLPNQGDGILITGHAHGNAIGGFQPSIEPQATISSNGRYGIEVAGSAHDNLIVHTYIGTNHNATVALGNALGGILLGPGTSSTTIGGASDPLAVKILDNGGAGVTIRSSRGNVLRGDDIEGNTGAGIAATSSLNTQIGSANAGNTLSGNGGDGIDLSSLSTFTHVQDNDVTGNLGNGLTLDGARMLAVGGDSASTINQIVGNAGYGLYASGRSTGTVLRQNVIQSNTKGNVDLTNSSGIVQLP